MNTPNDLTDEQRHALVDRGELPDPSACVPELFFTTKRRRQLPDIYECENGHQFPAEVRCPDCGSARHTVFMRAPIWPRLVGRDREAALTEIDPDWLEHFHGDVDRASNFYADYLKQVDR